MTLFTPLQNLFLLLNGHNEGLLYLKRPLPLGNLWRLFKFLRWTGTTPPFRSSLWLWYLCKHLSRTIKNSITLGFLNLDGKSFLYQLFTCGHLVIYPPQLVRHYVNNIRSKKVFQNSLNPNESSLLGKFSNNCVPYHNPGSIIRLFLLFINEVFRR